MQLKIKRSQREGGMISTVAIFCIDARVQFSAQEKQSITRYRLQNQIIYDSEAAKQMMARSENSRGRGIEYSGDIVSTLGSAASNALSGAKSLAFAALAKMKLSITIGSLERGQHVECKSLDELLGAEEAIMQACENLKGYLDTAATFDGREVLFDYATGSAQPVAMAATPEPMLISAPTDVEPEARPTSQAPPPTAQIQTVAEIVAVEQEVAPVAAQPQPESKEIYFFLAFALCIFFLVFFWFTSLF
jgi:hypothetical protein